MMDYATSVQRLQWHAGLMQCNVKQIGLSESVVEARLLHSTPDTIFLSEDILSVFAVVNRHLNGDVPSSVGGSEKKRYIEREVAYAVDLMALELFCALQHEGKYSPESLGSFERLLDIVLWCWNGVLAGDIDNLEQHVRLNAARSNGGSGRSATTKG
jgi:hypothetical protein